MKSLLTVGRAIGMLECGRSQSQVARILNVSRRSVRRWYIEFRNSQNVSRGKSTGPHFKTTPRSNRRLLRLANTNRFATTPMLQQMWGVNVSRWTISRILRRSGFRKYRTPIKPFLSPQNKICRYRWAQNHVFWQQERFQRVVWSDESRFRLFVNDGRIRVWRQRGERYRQDLIQHHTQAGGGSVHIWGAIWHGGRSRLQVLRQSVNAERYCDVLTNFLTGDQLPEIHWTFQHDNAPAHRANLVNQYLLDHNVPTMEWPSRSPDLNPIEHVWDTLGRRIQARNPQTLAKLEQMLLEEWVQIDQQYIDGLIGSMRRRITAVIEANGGNTRY